MRILLVEDDRPLGEGIRSGLADAGWTVDWVQDGHAAKLALEAESFALVVLDLGLPKLSGLDLLAWLRASGRELPVLVLTARDTVADRVRGLDRGADDYMVKPFELDELAARIRALTRRSRGASPTLRHGAVELDPAARTVTRDGVAVELSSREFALLHELLRQRGKVLSRGQLEQSVYGWGEEVESNAVEVHIHYLRRKLGAGLIRTVRGVGYTLGEAGQ